MSGGQKLLQEISSIHNPVVRHLVKLRVDPKYRASQNTVLISGSTMVSEVCRKGNTHKLLMVKGKDPPEGSSMVTSAPLKYSVPAQLLAKISGMQSIDDIHTLHVVAEVDMPRVHKINDQGSENMEALLQGKRLVLVLDRIADPGNLGTLIRTAYCFGWDYVCILDNSVDPFNDKALRSAKGSTFFIPIIKMTNWEHLQKYILSCNTLQKNARTTFSDVCAFSADASSTVGEENLEIITTQIGMNQVKKSTPVEVPKQIFLILGNESHGLSEEAKKISQPLTIPMQTGFNNGLNVGVAGGMLMWLLTNWKSRRQKTIK